MGKVALFAILLCFASPSLGQELPITLDGVVDIHVHQDPDSAPRAIDADDLARLAKARGMRGLVFKNHWEDTAALAYIVRKSVPGIEIFGGIAENRSVGGINPESVRHMAAMKGGYGRVVWLPTFDAENYAKDKTNSVRVSENGKLLPEVVALIDLIAQNPQLILETGHISADEALMVTHLAKERGVKKVVVTHPLADAIHMTIPQMQQAARDGAYLEFVYGITLELNAKVTLAQYAEAIRAIGAEHCVLSSDLGGVRPAPAPARPLEPQGMLDFMSGLHHAGIPVSDINLMAKTVPAHLLGLK